MIYNRLCNILCSFYAALAISTAHQKNKYYVLLIHQYDKVDMTQVWMTIQIIDYQQRMNQCQNKILILILPTSPSSQHSSQYLTKGIFYEF